MEIVKIASGDYERYEELLLQRDEYQKEAWKYNMTYTAVFGQYIIEAYRQMLESIKLKKAIAFAQTRKNKGQSATQEEINDYLKTQMTAYYERLSRLKEDLENVRNSRPIFLRDVDEVKKTYRRIAKLIHPDVCSLTSKHPELMELFQRAVAAYSCNDLQEITEIEVLVNKVLNDLGKDVHTVYIKNVKEKILQVEQDIHRIVTTEPYIYREILNDPEAVQAKKDKLTKDAKDCREYNVKLSAILRKLL